MYMLWWDWKFLNLANGAGVHIQIYKGYLDDTNIVFKWIEPNAKLDETRVKQIASVTTLEDEEKIDMRTTRYHENCKYYLKIYSMVESGTIKQSQGKLLILDLQCWHSNTPGAGTMIHYKFYRKPMATDRWCCTNLLNLLSEQVKRTTSS